MSKTKVFGIPLVHVNNKPMGVAKGIFSLGSIAIGIFSFGGISIGVFSFGSVSLAILIAFGGVAKGIIAVFNQDGTGQYMFKSPVNPDEVLAAIKQVYPRIERKVLNFIKIFLWKFSYTCWRY